MYGTILVPLDGSHLAERALPYARRLAAASGSRLVLLWVLRAPGAAAAGDPLREVAPRREAAAYLQGIAGQQGPTPVETVVLEGDAAPAIVDAAARAGAGLIVMSTHGRSGLGRWLYGSVADAVVRHAGVPVLLVPAACPARAWASDRPLQVLVPLDASARSEAVLPAARDLAATGAALILLSVTPQVVSADMYGSAYMGYDVEVDMTERRAYLERTATALRAAGYAVSVRDGFGFVPVVIGEVAEAAGADLIALATHGSGGATRLLMGSVATGVVQRAMVPVLVVRPADEPPAAPPPATPETLSTGSPGR